jgi:imidazolonepropionase
MKEARGALDIDVHGSVVMPGFVDAGLRITLQSAPGERPAKPKRIGRLFEDSLELLRSCMHHGTLSAELKATAAASDFHSDLSVLRRLAKIGNNPVAMIRTWELARLPTSGEHIADFKDTLQRLSSRGLVHFVEITTTPDAAITDDFVDMVRQADVGLKLAWTGGSPEALPDLLSRIKPDSISCPSTLTAAEAAAFSQCPCPVVFSPGYHLEQPTCIGLRQVADAGGAIALSSGYDANQAPGFSMQMAVSLAVMRGQLTVEEAITAATVNAAYAVGCGETAGTLEVGKRADILVLTIPDYREIPRQFGINHVGIVLRSGEVVLNRSRWKIGSHEPIAS